MLPRDLKPQQFEHYPAQARSLAVEHIGTLRRLPLTFLPSLLREVIDYDFKFPAERRSLRAELGNLKSLSDAQLQDWLRAFEHVRLSSRLQDMDWPGAPAQFVEELSAHLWTTHQMDEFRAAAGAYADRLGRATPPDPPTVPRLGITVIGQGVTAYKDPLFRKLRAHGAYFGRVKAQNGLAILLAAVSERAKRHAQPYAHWYIDGGQAAAHDDAVTCVSYDGLQPIRSALLRRIQAEVEKPGMGPEALRSTMAQLRPADLGFEAAGDPVLDRFQMKILTEGSGTQIFSTTFAQWAAREALRRAQPLTLLVRFAPRQRQKPMNELLSSDSRPADLDPFGSLLDADMGAYYNWLNQQRLPGSEQSAFLVWFENHAAALAIGPGMPRGTESASEADLQQLLSWIL